MKSESAELVSGLIRQYRRLRLLYLGYLAAVCLLYTSDAADD